MDDQARAAQMPTRACQSSGVYQHELHPGASSSGPTHTRILTLTQVHQAAAVHGHEASDLRCTARCRRALAAAPAGCEHSGRGGHSARSNASHRQRRRRWPVRPSAPSRLRMAAFWAPEQSLGHLGPRSAALAPLRGAARNADFTAPGHPGHRRSALDARLAARRRDSLGGERGQRRGPQRRRRREAAGRVGPRARAAGSSCTRGSDRHRAAHLVRPAQARLRRAVRREGGAIHPPQQ